MYAALLINSLLVFPLSTQGRPLDGDLLTRQSTNPLNYFLSMIEALPPIKLVVDDIAEGLTDLETLLIPVTGSQITRSDIADNASCADMTVVFARGTTEPGNMGVFVGSELVSAISNAMPGTSINVQGVEYAASVEGYLAGGGKDGATSMTDLIMKGMQACPNTKLVMSGYSQGGQVVHQTAAALPPETMAKVNSVVIFGDPLSSTPVQGAAAKTLVICHPDDDICEDGDIILPTHLTYGFDAPKAAAFVAQMAGNSRLQ